MNLIVPLVISAGLGKFGVDQWNGNRMVGAAKTKDASPLDSFKSSVSLQLDNFY